MNVQEGKMNRLREVRVIKRITQFQLALMTGLYASKISLIENGFVEPSADEMRKIAKALGVQAAEIWSERKDGVGNCLAAG